VLLFAHRFVHLNITLDRNKTSTFSVGSTPFAIAYPPCSGARHSGLTCYIDCFRLNTIRIHSIDYVRRVDCICHMTCFHVGSIAADKAKCSFSQESFIIYFLRTQYSEVASLHHMENTPDTRGYNVNNINFERLQDGSSTSPSASKPRASYFPRVLQKLGLSTSSSGTTRVYTRLQEPAHRLGDYSYRER
jgi:hypothetical protein